MARRMKIKRYRHIYRRKRFSAWKAAGVLAVACIAVFLGVSLYQPVRDFITGKLSTELMEKDRRKEPLQSQEEEEELPPPPEPAASSEASPPAPDPSSLRTVYVPQNVLAGGAMVSFVQNAGVANANAAAIDLKDENGRVLYQTRVDMAYDAGAVTEGGMDLQAVCGALKEAGYTVVGRICAFRDPLAPYAGDRIAAVKYQNTQLTWLDAAEEDGGEPWLNPYAPVAQSYVTDLALEAISMGVDIVMLDGVQFPEGQGLRMATYGEWAGGRSQDEALAQFVGSVREQAAQRGGAVFCAVSATDLLTGRYDPYGGVNPAGLFGPVLGVRVMPALFGEQFEGEGFVLSNPASTPYETVGTVLKMVKENVTGVSTLIPLVQGYDAAQTAKYSSQEIADQIRAVEEAQIGSYIVYFEPPLI